MARFNYDRPPELERIIRKCLEKDPERRYQSARELSDRPIDLASLLRELGRDAEGAAPAMASPKDLEGRLTRIETRPVEELKQSDIFLAYASVDDQPVVTGRLTGLDDDDDITIDKGHERTSPGHCNFLSTNPIIGRKRLYLSPECICLAAGCGGGKAQAKAGLSILVATIVLMRKDPELDEVCAMMVVIALLLPIENRSEWVGASFASGASWDPAA